MQTVINDTLLNNEQANEVIGQTPYTRKVFNSILASLDS